MLIFVNNYKNRRTVRKVKSTIKVPSTFRKLARWNGARHRTPELPEAGTPGSRISVRRNGRGPSANVGFPYYLFIGEGRVRFVRYHWCVRVLRMHTYRGGKKDFSRRKPGFSGSDRAGERRPI